MAFCVWDEDPSDGYGGDGCSLHRTPDLATKATRISTHAE